MSRRDAQGHQAVIDLFQPGRRAVDGGRKAVIIWYAEKHQPVGIIICLGGKAGAGGRKALHRAGAADSAILGVGVLGEVGQPVARDRLQQIAVGCDLVLIQQHGPQQGLGAVLFVQRIQLLLRDVILPGKAHRHPVFIFVDLVGGRAAYQRPTVQFFRLPVGFLILSDHRIAHAQQAAQGVVFDFRLGVDIPLDADLGVKLHNTGGHGGVEKLQAAFIKPQAQIVVRAVGVDAVEGVVRQGRAHFLDRVVGLRDKVAVGIPLGVLGQREMHAAVNKAEREHRRQQHGRPALAVAEKVPQHAKKQQSQHRNAKDGPEAGRLVGNAEGGHAVIVGVGHQAERRRRERDGQRQPPGARQLPPGQVGPRQQRRRSPAQHEHRHVIPPRVIAGIEGIKQAVEHRHKRADDAHL